MFILMLGACVLRSYLVEHPHITIRVRQVFWPKMFMLNIQRLVNWSFSLQMAALHVFIIIAVSISAGAVGMGAIFNASRVLAVTCAQNFSLKKLRLYQITTFEIKVLFSGCLSESGKRYVYSRSETARLDGTIFFFADSIS